LSEGYIQVPPDSTGKKIRTIERSIGANTVEEKVIELAEPVSGIVINPQLVGVQSGQVAVLSGQVVSKISGEVVRSSGEIYIAKVSGENVVITSGTVSLVSGGFVSALVSGTITAKVSGEVVRSSGEIYIAKVSGEVVRSSGEIYIAKVSGEVVETRPTGYSKDIVSGAVIRNIVSGQVVLHTVVLTDRASGYYMRIRDACSGAIGTIIAMPYAQTRAVEPATLIFDCIMTSGIVVDTSGTTWHATVTYRKPF